MTKTYLIHYESATGAHLWASVECDGRLTPSHTLTWFAVYEVPEDFSANLIRDPVRHLSIMARHGQLKRLAA